MTKDETIKLLAIIKAAYPSFARGMTKTETQMTIEIWYGQFSLFPFEVMLMAINKIIATNTFAPTPSEVRTKLKLMHYEAKAELLAGDINTEQANKLRTIYNSCKDATAEPSLLSLTSERRQGIETHGQFQDHMPSLPT